MAAVYHKKTNERVWAGTGGVFNLAAKTEYYYTATCYGYAGVTDTFTTGDEAFEITVTSEKVPGSVHGAGTSSYWPYFRGGSDADGIVDSALPTAPQDAILNWVEKIGDSYSSGATGCPILTTEDGTDCIITYAARTIVKVETVTGKVVARGVMDRASSFAINSPTYAEGMVFVALSNGGIQAFDAGTLESLWIYNDPLGGQPNCPITYKDGYIYTGFWTGEAKPANLVCLSVTDEVPSTPDEPKLAAWVYTSPGGFYWAGSYVGDGFMLVGTDDGKNGYLSQSSALLCIDPATGRMLDKIGGLHGDIRSSVTRSGERYYFTSKDGYFYNTEVVFDEFGTAGLNHSTFRKMPLDNYADEPLSPPMSTSSPVVYNGRAYIGVSGTSQFDPYTGHNITVIDLSSWEIAYSVRTQGYPQTSGLLTTAYESEDGYVYVYFIDNYTPGKLRAIKDKPGVTAPEIIDKEEFTSKGVTTVYDTARVIFTPSGDQAQYAICSPVADSYGSIYYKNDSSCMMGLGPAIEKIEVTKQPNKTEYIAGARFEPDGMEITISYVSGATRTLPWGKLINGENINYITWSDHPLEVSDSTFSIVFPYVMYGDIDGGTGVTVSPPSTVINLTISEQEVTVGDVNDDGHVTAHDASMILQHVVGLIQLSSAQEFAADVNSDGFLTALDASLILQFNVGKIEKLPI